MGQSTGGAVRVQMGHPVEAIPGLVAWYDASVASSITADGSGYVSQWNDLSGSGFHVSQATGTKQPRTGSRAIRGRNALDFDGGDVLGSGTTGTAIIGASTGYSLFAVVEHDVRTASYAFAADIRDPGDANPTVSIPASSFGSFDLAGLMRGTTGGLTEVGPASSTGLHLIILEWDGTTDAGGLTCEQDGTPGSATFAGTALGSMKNLYVGCNSAVDYFNGAWGELILCDGKVSADIRAATKTYLNAKWQVF
jgi:hypothetical protein